MSRINLKTVADVIGAFGGNKKLLAFCDAYYRQNVSNWRRKGQFPKGEHDRMTKWLTAHGYTASPALWGQEPEVPPRKRKRPKRKPVATDRQSKQSGGANGRNGKRQRAGTQKVARLAHRRTRKTVGNGVGLDDRRLVGHDPQLGDRQGEPATPANQETTG